MRIRIIEKGFEGYTGAFGVVEFVDGVSVGDVSQIEINKLSACIKIAPAEGGGQVSVASIDFDAPADVVHFKTNAEILEERASKQSKNKEGEAKGGIVMTGTRVYTREELEEIADKRGLEGLREIGNDLNIREKTIRKMIEAILKAQNAQVPSAE